MMATLGVCERDHVVFRWVVSVVLVEFAVISCCTGLREPGSGLLFAREVG